VDVEALNDQLAREHPIDDYYAKSPWAIRFVEKRRLRIIRDFMGDVDTLEVAEVGAGGGHVLRMFPRSRLTAFDVSSVYIEIARRNLAGYEVRFVKGELDKLDLTAESFDRVICTEVLEHVVDPDAVLAALARIVRASGLVVVTIPNDPLILRVKKVVRYTPLRWLLGGRVEWGGDRYHLHRWTPNEFERVLARHFRVLERRFAPFSLVRVRSCFKCAPRASSPSPTLGTDSGVT
jgi:SAM-dependent methyltransferase